MGESRKKENPDSLGFDMQNMLSTVKGTVWDHPCGLAPLDIINMSWYQGANLVLVSVHILRKRHDTILQYSANVPSPFQIR